MIMSQSGGRGFGGRKSLSIDSMEKLIDKAFSMKRCEAVLLNINSPGGSAVQSELIADYIGQKAKSSGVPILSFVEDMAASGGYWLATAAPTIYVTQSSIVGSIGVISQSFGFHEAISKLGIERRTMTAGESKAFSDPFKPWEEKDKAIVRQILASLHDNFKGQVKNARGDRLKEDESELFSGKVWVGQQAVDVGLVDGINSIHKFVESEFGDKVQLVRVEGNKFQFPFMSSSLEIGESPLVKTAYASHIAEAFLQEEAFFKGVRI